MGETLIYLFQHYFWYCILILVLSVNESTFILAMPLVLLLIIFNGVCPMWALVIITIAGVFLYMFSFRSFWKELYHERLIGYKIKVQKLKKENKRLQKILNGEGD